MKVKTRKRKEGKLWRERTKNRQDKTRQQEGNTRKIEKSKIGKEKKEN